jgi:hypothetical protein
LPYAIDSAISIEEIATYEWIEADTETRATFLIEDTAENLVYFGRRKILLPILGAEWVPSPVYGNGKQRSISIKNEIYTCREVKCLTRILSKYDVSPDYIIYRITDDSEKAWIEELIASAKFELAFESESMATLRIIDE